MRSGPMLRPLSFALIALISVFAPAAQSAEIKVLSAGAFLQVVQTLVPDFEKETGNTVKVETDTAGGLRRRVTAGEAFDVAIITEPVIDALITDRKLIASTHTKLATVGVGVGVKEGAPKPDISTVEGL